MADVQPQVIVYSADNVSKVPMLPNDNIWTGQNTIAPTLLLGAGTTLKAPLKFTAGSLLATPVTGAMEFSDGRWYLTGTSKQRVIDRTTTNVNVADVTIDTTAVETTLYSWSLSSNAMKAGRIYKIHLDGVASNEHTSDEVTLNVYFGGTLIGTATPTAKTYSATGWHLDFNITIRTVGNSGTCVSHGHFDIGTTLSSNIGKYSIDTTAVNTMTVKAKWNNSKAGNTITLYQAYMEFKN